MPRLALSFCVGLLACLLSLELLLRILPVQNGLFGGDPRPDWPLHVLTPNTTFTDSTAWNFVDVHRGWINSLGYVAPFDYEPGSGGIVVIGNSFIASTMNDYADTLQGSLREYLSTPHKVMGLGVAGAHMPDYLATARLAGARFQPDWAVIVVTATDFSRGFSADAGYCRWARDGKTTIECVPEVRSSELRKALRSLAIVRYVRANLRFSARNLIQVRRAPALEASRATCAPELKDSDRRLLSGFLDEVAPALGMPASHVIVVLDSDRRAMYAPEGAAHAPTCPSRDDLANDYLRVEAGLRGVQVVDSEPVFARYVAEKRERVDHTPNDSHWNAAAHRLMAQQVALIIDAVMPAKTD